MRTRPLTLVVYLLLVGRVPADHATRTARGPTGRRPVPLDGPDVGAAHVTKAPPPGSVDATRDRDRESL